MIIRQAKESDIGIILELALKFAAEYPDYFPIELNPEDVTNTLAILINSDQAEVIVAETPDKVVVGALAAIAQPVFYNMAEKYTQELLFYVLPHYRKTATGRRMKEHIEEWSKDVGAYGVGFGWLPGTIGKNTYLLCGYVERELHLSKVF